VEENLRAQGHLTVSAARCCERMESAMESGPGRTAARPGRHAFRGLRRRVEIAKALLHRRRCC